MLSVDLIIPDSGPLISLAHADRLDLLNVFERPVAILDVVKIECLRKEDSPDHVRLKTWFETAANRYRLVESPFAPLFQSALATTGTVGAWRATRGLGDAAIAWLLRNLREIAADGAMALVLTEDRDLTLDLADISAHLLSTRAWLAGLQRAKVIESADAVIAAMALHGRGLSSLLIDRDVVRHGERSNWEEEVAAAVKAAKDNR